MKTILILVEPAVQSEITHRETCKALHYAVKSAYDHWWHHIKNAYMVRTMQTPEEVYAWLNRTWPLLIRGGVPDAHHASCLSSVLVFEVEPSAMVGRLPNWEWLKKTDVDAASAKSEVP